MGRASNNDSAQGLYTLKSGPDQLKLKSNFYTNVRVGYKFTNILNVIWQFFPGITVSETRGFLMNFTF